MGHVRSLHSTHMYLTKEIWISRKGEQVRLSLRTKILVLHFDRLKLKWIFRIMFSLSSTSRSKHLCQHFHPGHPPGEKKRQTVESQESKEAFKPSRHTEPPERLHVQGYRNPFIFQITSNAHINSTRICLVPCKSCN